MQDQEQFIAELTRRYIEMRRQRAEQRRQRMANPSSALTSSVDDALARAMANVMNNSGEVQMKAKIINFMDQCVMYEDESLLDKARTILPVERLHQEARELSEKESMDFFEALLRRLLHFWKIEFFTWVNTLPCPTEGCQGKTENDGMVQPTEDDVKWGARRVELHKCPECKSEQRFPRYNHPGRLLDSRRGRCGEWANCFTLASRAMGFQSRLVFDTTDHVWTEIYLDSRKSWVHTDPCENALDTPKVYEAGWGKKLEYLLAFTAYEATDVSKRYTNNFDDLLTRRKQVSEEFLSKFLGDITKQRLSILGSDVAEYRLKERLADMESIDKEYQAQRKAKEEELQVRQSGSEEWKRARGEMGDK